MTNQTPVMLELINGEWECLNPDCEHDGVCCGPEGEHHDPEALAEADDLQAENARYERF